MQQHNRGLEREHGEQHERSRIDEWFHLRVDHSDPPCDIGQIQGAQGAVQQAQPQQKHRGSDQVQHHVGETGPAALTPAAMQQETVRGKQQNLEEHEEVEQVAGKEGTVDAHELELEQRVKTPTLRIGPTGRIDHAAAGQ